MPNWLILKSHNANICIVNYPILIVDMHHIHQYYDIYFPYITWRLYWSSIWIEEFSWKVDLLVYVIFCQTGHGSLLQYGRLLRYTPYKDYYGNDSFSYTMSDINGNLATATVNISVLSIPPQFVSSPSELQATEDVVNPRFG